MEQKISKLPEEIIHHILPYFTTKEAARVCLFCKAWHRAWLTCPTLYFRGGLRHPPTQELFKVFQNTLRRYQDQKIPIEQLFLDVLDFVTDSSSVSVVNECIEIAVQNGVRKLELLFPCGPDAYTLPGIIFEAKTLRELTVGGNVELKKGAGEEVMLKYLQKLHLWGAYIDDDLFRDIITRCPLLSDLHIYGFDETNFEYLDCLAWSSLDLYVARKLKYLSLVDCFLPATSSDNFMHNFPQLEDLTLKYLRGLKRINIASHSLKRITLGLDECPGDEGLKEVKIDAPSMVSLSLSLDLRYGFYPALSLANAPSHQWVSNISFNLGYTFKFCKLREYLSKLVQSKISLALSFNADCSCFDHVGHNPICPEVVIEVEDIGLKVLYKDEGLMINPNFLDGLFQTCHPKAITARRCEETTCKFLYENLIEARRNHDCHQNKSWYKDLKEVRFEIYNEITQEWQPRLWKGILEDMLQKNNNKRKASSNWDKICFRLEWEV